jgi:hypothetical protein
MFQRFPHDSGTDVFEDLLPDRCLHAELLPETRDQIVPVLLWASHDVVGDADIERAVALSCEKVN